MRVNYCKQRGMLDMGVTVVCSPKFEAFLKLVETVPS